MKKIFLLITIVLLFQFGTACASRKQNNVTDDIKKSIRETVLPRKLDWYCLSVKPSIAVGGFECQYSEHKLDTNRKNISVRVTYYSDAEDAALLHDSSLGKLEDTKNYTTIANDDDQSKGFYFQPVGIENTNWYYETYACTAGIESQSNSLDDLKFVIEHNLHAYQDSACNSKITSFP